MSFKSGDYIKSSTTTIEQRVVALEKSNYRLSWGFRVVVSLCLAMLAFELVMHATASDATNNVETKFSNSVLRVRGLSVVDANGIERVSIGAPLPDPPIFGKRIDRGSPVSGIILMDADGTERSGYVTGDETGQVLLTLDEAARMAASFSADKSGGVRLRIFDKDNNSVSLGTVNDGPYLELRRRGQLIMEAPKELQQEKK
jgi:hypothetical protein